MSLVSVIIPTYNRRHFLERAVKSVLDQSYRDIECIVVDDGSTDGTRDFLRSMSDWPVHAVYRDRPLGLSSARNSGLAVASGEYVSFLDDDDRLYEDAITTLVETIRDLSDSCGMVYTARRDVWESGKTTRQQVLSGHVETYEATPNIGGPSCTLVRASVFEEIGDFDESFPAREDVDLWIRLLAQFSMVGIDQVLYERYHHEDQLSEDVSKMIEGQKRLLDKHGNSISNAALSTEYVLMAHAYALDGELGDARSALRAAVRTDPRNYAAYFLYCSLLFGTKSYQYGQAGRALGRRLFEIFRSRRG